MGGLGVGYRKSLQKYQKRLDKSMRLFADPADSYGKDSLIKEPLNPWKAVKK